MLLFPIKLELFLFNNPFDFEDNQRRNVALEHNDNFNWTSLKW